MPFDPYLALATLQRHEVRFVMIGGFAGAILGSGVLTQDLDLCYRRDDENLERLVAALEELDARLRGVEEDVPFVLDAATLRNGDSFTFQTTAGPIDIIGTPSGTNGFHDLEAAALDMDLGDGVRVRVASIDDLMRMKRAAARPKDLIHLEQLAALRDQLESKEPPAES
ncbi:MAG: hypothetical protein WD206_01990 [Actinomycetota bacterium]